MKRQSFVLVHIDFQADDRERCAYLEPTNVGASASSRSLAACGAAHVTFIDMLRSVFVIAAQQGETEYRQSPASMCHGGSQIRLARGVVARGPEGPSSSSEPQRGHFVRAPRQPHLRN
jgi:hypothetical protein